MVVGLWALWAVSAVWLLKAILARAFRMAGASRPKGMAYGLIVVHSITATPLILKLSDFEFYGFDRGDPAQVMGYVALFLSPFGLPLLIGLPASVCVDWLLERHQDSRASRTAESQKNQVSPSKRTK